MTGHLRHFKKLIKKLMSMTQIHERPSAALVGLKTCKHKYITAILYYMAVVW